MYKNKKILAIIPARSGSKGLVDKNIKKLNGKPLIAYTIEATKKSNIFDQIIVTTDSEEYATISRQYGAEVPFLRPSKLSLDNTSSMDVIIHVLDELKKQGKVYDCFMLLQPTSPLRTKDDILNSVKMMFDKNANSIVSVCEVDHNPLWSNTLDQTLSLDEFIKEDGNIRRQELPTYYRLNGAIYLSNTNSFLENKTFYKKSFAYIMSKQNSVDIDDELDFKLAELISKKI